MLNICNTGSAMSDAAMAAIHFGQTRTDAGVDGAKYHQLYGVRYYSSVLPLDELHQWHPVEANPLERISRSSDSAVVAYPKYSYSLIHSASWSLEEDAQAHRRLAKEYKCTLSRIHSLPGFNEFLHPQKSESLRNAAPSGPGIIINMHETRCNALILLPRSSRISHVPLPKASAVSIAANAPIRRVDATSGHHSAASCPR